MPEFRPETAAASPSSKRGNLHEFLKNRRSGDYEISRIHLTGSFQHVQWIKGGLRTPTPSWRRNCIPPFPGRTLAHSNGWYAPSARPQRGAAMLVLSRKKNESIIINDNITVTVIEIRGDKVRLGIEAPKDVTVHRREVYEAIQNQARSSDQGAKVGRPEV
jgi:carbon storage regulator